MGNFFDVTQLCFFDVENRHFGSEKSKVSRGNFRGESPPPPSALFDPPLSRFPTWTPLKSGFQHMTPLVCTQSTHSDCSLGAPCSRRSCCSKLRLPSKSVKPSEICFVYKHLLIISAASWRNSRREGVLLQPQVLLDQQFTSHGVVREEVGGLVARAIRNAIDSRESFAVEAPIFVARQADSHKSLEFSIRANHPIRANRANRFARITPLRSEIIAEICLKKFSAKFPQTLPQKMKRMFANFCKMSTDFLGSMFLLELGVDFDRGFSSGFSFPDIFDPFSVFAHAHKASKSVTKSVFFHRKTQDKKSATKSVAKSVPLGQKVHRKIRHGHWKNPPQFHSAETCALDRHFPEK